MLGGKFIAVNTYIKKISNQSLSFHLKKTRKRRARINPKQTKKEIIKISMEISEIENKNSTRKINESNCWVFEKIKFGIPLATLTKEERRHKLPTSRIKEVT